MADLSLKIKADFESAQSAFKKLSSEAKDADMTMTGFARAFADKHTDHFIATQQRAGAAIASTRGDLAALTAQQAAYAREIERLIKSGLDPENEQVQRLQDEYKKTTNEINAVVEAEKKHKEALEATAKAQDALVKGAAVALAAIAAATAAAGAYAIKAAADIEDMTAAYTPLLGTTEAAKKLVKDIQMEAAKTPFEIEAIGSSVKALLPAFKGSSSEAMKSFKMIGDTAQGSGEKLSSITNAYTKVMLKGKVSMQELNMIANAGVPIYDELAKSMGVSTAQMMEMSSDGKITAQDLTDSFQKMTSEGGIFYKGMEVSSTTFSATMLGVKENVNIAASAIGEALLPAAKDIAQGVYDATRQFIDWVNSGDNAQRMVEGIGVAIAGTTAALGTFIVVSKGHAIVTAMAAAVNALKAAFFPAGVIAMAVGAAVTAIAALAAHSAQAARSGETLAKTMRETKEKTSELFQEYDNLTPEKQKDFNLSSKLLLIYPELASKIDVSTASYKELKEAIADVNTEREKEAEDEIRKWQGKIADAAKAQKQYRNQLVQSQNELVRISDLMARNLELRPEVDWETFFSSDIFNINRQIEDVTVGINNYTEKIGQYRNQANALLAEFGKKLNHENIIVPIDIQPDLNESNVETEIESVISKLSERLSKIEFNPTQNFNDNVTQLQSFLQERLNLQMTDAEKNRDLDEQEAERRKSVLRALYNNMLASGNVFDAEKTAARRALEQAIAKIDEEAKADQEKRDKEAEQKAKEAAEEQKNAIIAILATIPENNSKTFMDLQQQFTQYAQARIAAETAYQDQLNGIANLSSDEKIKIYQDEWAKILEKFTAGSEEYKAADAAFQQGLTELQNTAAAERMAKLLEFDAIKDENDILKREERLAAMRANLEEIKNMEFANADEREKREKELAEKIYNEEEAIAKAKLDLQQKQLSATAGFFGSLSGLMDAFGEKNRAAFIASRIFAAAEAGINSYAAFTKALNDPTPMPTALRAAQAVSILISGLAAQANIWKTVVPSAETGGRFIVPDVAARNVDGVGMMVNPGEEINVTPRGMASSGGEAFNFTFIFDGQPFARIVNKLARRGELYTLQLAGNT